MPLAHEVKARTALIISRVLRSTNREVAVDYAVEAQEAAVQLGMIDYARGNANPFDMTKEPILFDQWSRGCAMAYEADQTFHQAEPAFEFSRVANF